MTEQFGLFAGYGYKVVTVVEPGKKGPLTKAEKLQVGRREPRPFAEVWTRWCEEARLRLDRHVPEGIEPPVIQPWEAGCYV